MNFLSLKCVRQMQSVFLIRWSQKQTNLKKNIITLDAIYEMKQATLHPLQPQTPHLTPSPVWLGQESSPRCGFFFSFFLFFPLSEVGHKDLAVWRGVGVLNFTDLEVSL